MHSSSTLRARVLSLALSLVPPAAAQVVAPAANAPARNDSAIRLEAFTVTGSNFKRLDQEKVLPITVFNLEAMEARNALTPVDLLTALPQITNLPLNESQNGGANARGDNANVNLRGLGAGNTLVLLNGRRIAPHPITSNDGGVPAFYANVNQLPTQGVERIDVLRDGASSIYGSDAVAGVINYVTRRDFRGTELRLRLGAPQRGGGENLQATVTYGRDFAGGRGRLLATLDHFQREEIGYSERSYTRDSNHTAQAPAGFNAIGGSFDGRSSVGIYPSFRIGSATTANFFRPINGALTLTTSSPTASVAARTASPEFFTNINAYQNTGHNRSNRQNFFTALEYDLTDRVTAFADFSVYHAQASIRRQPVQLNAPGSDQFAPMSVDNPFNPYGSRFYSPTGAPNADGSPRLNGAPQQITLVSVLLADVGPERIEVNSGVYRGVAGLRGRLPGDWVWETAALHTRAYTADVSNNAARESLFQRALMRTDATAFNPFGATFRVAGNAVVHDRPYTNPEAALSTFVQKWRHDGFSAITSVDARASGPVLRYWGNTASLAAGVEYRREQFLDTRPAYVGSNPPGVGLNENDNDYLVASYAPDSTGNRGIWSGYAEAVLPLVAPRHRLPLIQSFELTGSARHERYSDFGNTTRPKVGANWKPAPGLMIRASYNEGFAAPNLPTLYAPTRFIVDSAPGQTDVYRNQTVGNATYVMRRYSTGNLDLKPVESVGKSVGVVLEVPKVKGLTVTADYWQIDQTNIIGSYTDAQLFNSDAAKLNAYTQSQIAAGRPITQIDLGSGTAAYKGDPAIVRTTPTAADIAAFAAYNANKPPAQQAAVVGTILSRSIRFQNLAQSYASGVDLSLSYQLPWDRFGRFGFSADWSYLARNYQRREVPGGAPEFIERMAVDGNTRWRGSAAVTWRRGAWTAGLSGYYIGRFADTATTTAATYASLGEPRYISKQFDSGRFLYRYMIGDVTTYNAFAGYRFGREASAWVRNTHLRLGVVNLTDREPPLTSGALGYSPSVHGGLFPGRTWTLELSRRL